MRRGRGPPKVRRDTIQCRCQRQDCRAPAAAIQAIQAMLHQGKRIDAARGESGHSCGTSFCSSLRADQIPRMLVVHKVGFWGVYFRSVIQTWVRAGHGQGQGVYGSVLRTCCKYRVGRVVGGSGWLFPGNGLRTVALASVKQQKRRRAFVMDANGWHVKAADTSSPWQWCTAPESQRHRVQPNLHFHAGRMGAQTALKTAASKSQAHGRSELSRGVQARQNVCACPPQISSSH